MQPENPHAAKGESVEPYSPHKRIALTTADRQVFPTGARASTQWHENSPRLIRLAVQTHGLAKLVPLPN